LFCFVFYFVFLFHFLPHPMGPGPVTAVGNQGRDYMMGTCTRPVVKKVELNFCELSRDALIDSKSIAITGD
jgi:hypothetical protein